MKMIYFTDGKSFATAISVDLFQTKSQIHFQLLSLNERKTLSDTKVNEEVISFTIHL